MGRLGSQKDIHTKFWKAQIEKQIRKEYEEYLQANGQSSSSNNAHHFARKKIKESGGFNYHGYNERQIILLLENELPEFYD